MVSNLFLDTSALAKRYIRETGSTWVENLSDPSAGNVIVVAWLVEVELFSLFARRHREKALSAADLTTLQNEFLTHAETAYLVVPIDETNLTWARDLVSRYQLRALDAIHLACAVKAQAILGEPLTFISADVNQLTAASGEGFATDSPLAHP